MGRWLAEQSVGNLEQHALPAIMGLRLAEQTVGNLKKRTFTTSGTLVRRTKRRKSQNMNLLELLSLCGRRADGRADGQVDGHLSRAVSLPGEDFFPRTFTFLE